MLEELRAILTTATLTLPAIEVAALIIIISLCLVFKVNRVGLIVAYLFSYRWGWLLCMGQGKEVLIPYLVFGCTVIILTVVSMLRSRG